MTLTRITFRALERAGAARRPCAAPVIGPIFAAMRHAVSPRTSSIRIRRGLPSDAAELARIENEVFATDRISDRSFRRFLVSANAGVLVAEIDGASAGYAVVLYRTGSSVARLYSIATAAEWGGRGVAKRLLAAAEEQALARECVIMRLEVHEDNAAAISLYRDAGYQPFARAEEYYEDKGHALRFEKRLSPPLPRLRSPPPYFHQTTEFTCGPACLMMTLAWADPGIRMNPGLEFRLWREATTIFMTSGHGGCDPYGLAVTLKRHGLEPEIHVSKRGPYFLETVRSEDKRRVMRLTQEDFRRDAMRLRIPVHLAPLDERGLNTAFDTGAVAIVLVSGYHMVRKREPHWVFAFGRDGHYVLVHDPAAKMDDKGVPVAATFAAPWVEFERMMRFGRDLRAAVLVRKGASA